MCTCVPMMWNKISDMSWNLRQTAEGRNCNIEMTLNRGKICCRFRKTMVCTYPNTGLPCPYTGIDHLPCISVCTLKVVNHCVCVGGLCRTRTVSPRSSVTVYSDSYSEILKRTDRVPLTAKVHCVKCLGFINLFFCWLCE